mgnify:CR=1 FL=1
MDALVTHFWLSGLPPAASQTKGLLASRLILSISRINISNFLDCFMSQNNPFCSSLHEEISESRTPTLLYFFPSMYASLSPSNAALTIEGESFLGVARQTLLLPQ